jgi:hypothetical protein
MRFRIPCFALDVVKESYDGPGLFLSSPTAHVRRFSNFSSAHVCVSEPLSRKSKRIQNAAKYKQTTPKHKELVEWNYSDLTQLCHL